MEKNKYVIGLSNIDNIADEVVKLFYEPAVISSVCTCTKVRETRMINGKYICSICNKPILQTELIMIQLLPQ